MRENVYAKNLEFAQAKFKQEQKNQKTLGYGTNQEQLGNKKFQDIAEERFVSKLAALQGKQINATSIYNAAKAQNGKMAAYRSIAIKKWN